MPTACAKNFHVVIESDDPQPVPLLQMQEMTSECCIMLFIFMYPCKGIPCFIDIQLKPHVSGCRRCIVVDEEPRDLINARMRTREDTSGRVVGVGFVHFDFVEFDHVTLVEVTTCITLVEICGE